MTRDQIRKASKVAANTVKPIIDYLIQDGQVIKDGSRWTWNYTKNASQATFGGGTTPLPENEEGSE
jgi:hypothetical protein